MQIKDLIVLVADKNIQAAIEGILSRPEALKIREISFDVFTHLHRDPGCLLESHSFLLPFRDAYEHSIVIFDRQGCGQESKSRDELETQVEELLFQNSWEGRSVSLVIDPELEIWVWSNSPHVSTILGWREGEADLNNWLLRKKYLFNGQSKPQMPKEVLEEVLRITKKPRSSSIYLQLAQKVSLQKCVDPSFLKLRATLQNWFSKG